MVKRQVLFRDWWQAALLVFLVALAVRLATLNHMGKTWDEPAYVETGYTYISLIRDGNFTDPFWHLMSDHPPLIRYVYGFAGILDIREFDSKGNPVYHYNYTYPRIVSAILGSISSVFLVILGYRFFSGFIGLASGIIFALIPFFIGLSQLATLESFVMFFFTGSTFFYLLFLSSGHYKHVLLAGVLAGFALLVKQSNIILLPLLLTLSFIPLVIEKKANLMLYIKKTFQGLLLLFLASISTFFILWPMPFFNISETWSVQQTMWVDAVKLPPPEVFFGKLMLVPFPYYVIMFLITTPLLLLVLSMLGMLRIDKNKSFIGIAVIVWFLFPFLQSFYAFKQHGVRYIVEIYAPFALLCGIGIYHLASFFEKKMRASVIILFVTVCYLGIILVKTAPYYLDYFNEVVGGNRYVYNERLFQMGWWGQGIGEAAFYISNNEQKTVTVGLDGAQPMIVAPSRKNLMYVDYTIEKNPDYVIVPYFNVVRLGFPESDLSKNYKVIHTVRVDSVPLVKVYKRSTPDSILKSTL